MNEHHENVLPEAVRKQVAQADAIIAQMNQEELVTEPAKELVTEPAKEPAKEPAPIQTQAKEPVKEREDWKHKYSVLKGKYDAEVPRLTADLREARGQVNGMQQQLNNLQATVAGLKEINNKPAEPPKPLVSQEEIDQFGPDLIDVVERVARQAIAPYVDKKVGEVANSVKQVNESVASQQKSMAESARGRLYERLDDEVPGWEVINKDPEFVAWLHQVDDFSGLPRGGILRGAFERNDADRVVKVFKGFQKEHVVENSDPNNAAPAPKETSSSESQQTLDSLVAPGTPKTGSTDAQTESGKGRIWTRKDITAFHIAKNEWVRKRPNGDLPKEIVDAERDLFKAQSEGRIRN